jgi:hypothetical protein
MFRWIPPAWRSWLKRSRLPGLRHAVKAIRLGVRLRQLGHLLSAEDLLHIQAAVGQLPAQRAAIEQHVANLEACVHHVANLEARVHHVTNLEARVHHVAELNKHYYHHLCDQTDLHKSAGEVPLEWFEEFRCWKQENPLPQRPRVSICVATWNRSKLLTQRCLPSLLRQTYKHLEIVVVGDQCTDDTAPRIAALKDPRIRFVNLPQRGQYPEEKRRRWMVAGTVPMNHALSLCTGDFITHLDDDDEHEPERVEKLIAFARENDLDFVWHPFWYEHAPGSWEIRPCEELRGGQVTTSSIFYRRWLARIPWDINAHMLGEPGDWNRLRKFVYLGVKAKRFPEPLLRHHAEQSQPQAAAA